MESFSDLISNTDSVSNPVDLFNNLFDKDNLNMITELDINKIRVLVTLKWYSLSLDPAHSLKPIDNLNKTLEYYKELLISLKRKSRNETVEAFRNIFTTMPQTDESLMSNISKKL